MNQLKKVILLGAWLLLFAGASAAQADSTPKGTLIPYLAVGGARSGLHYETLLLVANLNRATSSGKIHIFDEGIQPLPIALDGDRGLLAEFPWTVPPGRSKQFRLTLPAELVHSGWMRVIPSGTEDVELIVVIRIYDGAMLLSQDGIVFPSRKNTPLPLLLASWAAGSPAFAGRGPAEEFGRGERIRPGGPPPFLRQQEEEWLNPARRFYL